MDFHKLKTTISHEIFREDKPHDTVLREMTSTGIIQRSNSARKMLHTIKEIKLSHSLEIFVPTSNSSSVFYKIFLTLLSHEKQQNRRWNLTNCNVLRKKIKNQRYPRENSMFSVLTVVLKNTDACDIEIKGAAGCIRNVAT